tara:strand:- start:107 stop:2041 length:1935 start_codon:yes stop_codon:yes gene_type:complete
MDNLDDPDSGIDRKYVTPKPFQKRNADLPTTPLPLVFKTPTVIKPGLDNLSHTTVREFVLQDLDVAAARRGGLPPSDAQISVENLLDYILTAEEFQLEAPPEPEPEFVAVSCLQEAAQEEEPEEAPFELPFREKDAPDYHRRVLAAAATILERGSSASEIAFIKWSTTVLRMYPPGEKTTLRNMLSTEGLQSLDLPKLGLVAGDAKVIAQYISLAGERLWTLDLSCNNIGDVGAEAIARAIITPLGKTRCDVRALNLSSNGIGALPIEQKKKKGVASLRKPNASKDVGRGARALGDLIRANKSIKTLNLSSNHFGPVTSREIAHALATNGSLTELDFSRQNDPRHPGEGIGKEGAASFAGVMATGGTKIALRILDLSNDGLGSEGAKALEEALGGKRRRKTRLTAAVDSAANDGIEKAKQQRATSLKDLRLSYNQFGWVGAASMGRLLAANGNLTSLDLSYNGLGELNNKGHDGKGITKLAHGLGKNACLKSLNLAGNGVSNRGATAIAQALRSHTTMATIQLRNNEIELVGAMELAKLAHINPKINVVDVAGNIMRPQVEELRAGPRPGAFHSRVAPTREESGAMWVHRDLDRTVKMGLGRALKTSVQIPRNVLIADRNSIRVPSIDLPQARRFDRPRKRFNI